MGILFKVGSNYDFVCSGLSKGYFKEVGGMGFWGYVRFCRVEDKYYKVVVMMGDWYVICSKIMIFEVFKWGFWIVNC